MIVAYMPVLYGREYIYHAIRSVIDHVDRFYVLYTPVGSHGSRTALTCPDSRDDLYKLAELAARDKLVWIESDQWTNEGQQRMTIMGLIPDSVDLIIPVDYDEIWQPDLLELAIQTANASDAHTWRIPFRHYWRSFYRCVVDDTSYPVRLIKPSGHSGEMTLASNGLAVNHMGYSIAPDLMYYKWKVHGHKAEYRTDIDWFRDRYLTNTQRDCHPTNVNYWNPVAVDPWSTGLPSFMRNHEYADCEVID